MTQKNLTSQDIFTKNFKTSLRGYNSIEVDAFLDQILEDYDAYDKEIQSLKSENGRLMQLLQQGHSLSDEAVNAKTSGTTNFDVLKRLSNLEKHVFGSKLDN